MSSGHSGQELKCSEEEPGRVSTASPGAHGARRPARPAPKRGASELRSRCWKPDRASIARPLPKFARGPRRAGNRERSAAGAAGATATAGLESPREGRAGQRVRVTPRRSKPGLRSPQLLAPPGQGGEEAVDSETGLFWRLEAPGRVG